MRRHLLPLLVLALATPLSAQSTWTLAPPTSVVFLGAFQDTALTEVSAAAASRTQPGVIWTLNDSGNPPWIYAVDTAGHKLGSFRVVGAQNFDWETLTLAPCPSGTCVIIGDTGDNPEKRPSARLYRVPEPEVSAASAGELVPTAPAESLIIQYADGPHDVEAIYADSVGNIFLVTKGRSKGMWLLRIPASAWTASGPVVPERLDSLPITPDISYGQQVSDAALSPDGTRLAVRTYSAIFFFAVGPGGRIAPDRGEECFFGDLEPQGEGITWLDNRRLLLTGESSATTRGPLYLLECGQP